MPAIPELSWSSSEKEIDGINTIARDNSHPNIGKDSSTEFCRHELLALRKSSPTNLIRRLSGRGSLNWTMNTNMTGIPHRGLSSVACGCRWTSPVWHEGKIQLCDSRTMPDSIYWLEVQKKCPNNHRKPFIPCGLAEHIRNVPPWLPF
jgi:hypothetical protein